MPEDYTVSLPLDSVLENKSVEGLLLFVADGDQGLKPAALERLLALDFETIYPILENGVRNDGNADLRNGSMEVLVKFGKSSIGKLIKLLHDQNEEIRNFAAVMLGDIGNREAVGALIQALSDKDPNVSHGAAEALGKIGDRAALLPLVELLKGDFWLQYAAITAIGAMRDHRAVPHLLNLLENELLAGTVVQTLGEIGDPRALYPLCNLLTVADDNMAGLSVKAIVNIYRHANETFKYKNSLSEFSQPDQLRNLVNNTAVSRLHAILENNSESSAVEAAITLLGWIGDISALEYFYSILDNPEYMQVVENAVLSLGKSAVTSLTAALEHPNDNVMIVAIRSLRWLGDQLNDTVLAKLITSENEAVQIETLETLKNYPAIAMLPALYELLMHDNSEIHRRAAEALGKFPLDRTRQFLDDIISSDESTTRKRAAMLLGNLPEGGGTDLIARLAVDDETEVRSEVMKAVGLQRVAAALPILHQALSDPETTVREAAIMALAEFGSPNYAEELIALLQCDNIQLKYAIIKALGMMAAVEAGSYLIKILQEENTPRNLEYAIIETLGKINFTASSRLISGRYLHHADPDIRRLAVETLGKFGDPHSLRAIETAAQDSHWSVRVAALHLLGSIGGTKELPILVAAMEDKDFLVRKNAILALGNIHDISTVPALSHQLNDMEMSRFAFEALLKYGRMALPWLHRLMTKNFPLELRIRVIDLIGKIADSKSVTPLLGLLDESNAEIRVAAIDALTFCYDSLPLKKLASMKKNDNNEEVKERAELALNTFLMEKYF